MTGSVFVDIGHEVLPTTSTRFPKFASISAIAHSIMSASVDWIGLSIACFGHHSLGTPPRVILRDHL